MEMKKHAPGTSHRVGIQYGYLYNFRTSLDYIEQDSDRRDFSTFRLAGAEPGVKSAIRSTPNAGTVIRWLANGTQNPRAHRSFPGY